MNEITSSIIEMNNFFSKFGLEVIGSKEHNNEKVFLIKRKNKE